MRSSRGVARGTVKKARAGVEDALGGIWELRGSGG